jgi:hypothetical protein
VNPVEEIAALKDRLAKADAALKMEHDIALAWRETTLNTLEVLRTWIDEFATEEQKNALYDTIFTADEIPEFCSEYEEYMEAQQ